MRRSLLRLAFAILFGVAASGVAVPAQADKTADVFARGCGDDDGNDRCDPEIQRKMLALYGLQPVAALKASGLEVRRAMIVDGYGNDVVAVTFTRSAQGEVRVEARSPCGGQDGCEPPLAAMASNESWQTISRLPERVGRRAKTRSSGKDEEITICLHGWFVVVEAAERGVPAKRGRTFRLPQNACSKGQAVDYAFDLASKALDNLPDCATLKRDDFRNAASLLQTCGYFGGSRRLAGEAYPIIRDLDLFLAAKPDSADYGLQRLPPETAKRLQKAAADGRFYYSAIRGIEPGRVEVKGRLYFDGEDEQRTAAPLEFVLVREGDRFLMDQVVLGEPAPVK